MDIGGPDVEAFPAAGVGVDLQLQGVFGQVAGRGLVVEDGQRGRCSALVVEDHVGPAGDGDALDVQLEGALGLPDAVEVGGVGGDVLDDQASGRVLQLAVGHLVGGGQEEVVVEDVLDLGGRRDRAGGPGDLGHGAQHVVDGFAVAQLGGQAGLEADQGRSR